MLCLPRGPRLLKCGLFCIILVALVVFILTRYDLDTIIRTLSPTAAIYGQQIKPHLGDGFVNGKDSALAVEKLFKKPNTTFNEFLKAASDVTKVLVMSIIDSNFVPFARNFREHSLSNLTPHYLLLICLDQVTKIRLQEHGLNCFVFRRPGNITMLPSGGDFGSSDYFIKTNLKTHIILQAIQLGYTVFHIDQDVTLFKNPFQYFTCVSCDIHVQRDRVQINSGFIYVSPTETSKRLYRTAWELYVQYNKSHDQTYLNMAAHAMKIANQTIAIETLPPNRFMCGVFYFENGNRMFGDKPCPECVMVHHNYIGSLAAKEYRMKENLMWFLDDHGYYSSQENKYLVYGNPAYFGDNTLEVEKKTLYGALIIANLTGRILILPKFHCCQCKTIKKCSGEKYLCSLLAVLRITSFDELYKGKYREHSFLRHPKVPNATKEYMKQAPMFRIKTEIYDSIMENPADKNNIINLKPMDVKRGATAKEIGEWMEPYKSEKILRFHSLYTAFKPSSMPEERYHERQLNNYFLCSEFQQWDDHLHNA